MPENKLLAKSLGLANSPAWSSPELLASNKYSFPHDTFSFGVILWEILTLQVPWKSEEVSEGYRMGMSQVKIVETMNKVGMTFLAMHTSGRICYCCTYSQPCHNYEDTIHFNILRVQLALVNKSVAASGSELLRESKP